MTSELCLRLDKEGRSKCRRIQGSEANSIRQRCGGKFEPMASEKEFSIDMTLEEIMVRWPQTVGVILRRRMLCIGCPIADFHTPVDAAREHLVEPDEFEADLKNAIGGKVKGNRG